MHRERRGIRGFGDGGTAIGDGGTAGIDRQAGPDVGLLGHAQTTRGLERAVRRQARVRAIAP